MVEDNDNNENHEADESKEITSREGSDSSDSKADEEHRDGNVFNASEILTLLLLDDIKKYAERAENEAVRLEIGVQFDVAGEVDCGLLGEGQGADLRTTGWVAGSQANGPGHDKQGVGLRATG